MASAVKSRGAPSRRIGSTNYCKAHGGGKRCREPGCTKGAEGSTNYCVAHGGGRRCQEPGCTKSAQGSTDYCKAHDGKHHGAFEQVLAIRS